MISSERITAIKAKYSNLEKEFDERSRRIWAATEAGSLGYGGVAAISKATGMAESTIRIGLRELKAKEDNNDDYEIRRIRKEGGGRKPLIKSDKSLVKMLESLVEPSTRGDPMSPLRWTCKSTRNLSEELTSKGHPVSHAKVGKLLESLGYSLQSTRKKLEGKSHPDRDAQFKFIYKQVIKYQRRVQPVISVDTKKKELIGNFCSSGKEFQPKGKPEEVETYDFPQLSLGKGIPYGVYDMTKNQGWVSVGTDHDTAKFAVQTILQWWNQMGRITYPNAKELLITADGGGSNGSRNRQWKLELQGFVDETGLMVSVCHFPPGTSKWNKIEHQMFSYITKNWRGKPLTSHEVIVNLISNTRTKAGLNIQAELDSNKYPLGVKVSDEELKSIKLKKNKFHGEWNYTISPRASQ